MPKDKHGNEYTRIGGEKWKNVHGDIHEIVETPEGKRLLFNNTITTIEPDCKCPTCGHDRPTVVWETPSAAFCCAKCGYKSLGTLAPRPA